MKMGYGLWIVILGILAIIVGGIMYEYYHHIGRDGGIVGMVLGIILVIVGVWWWMKKDKSAAKAVMTPQPAQPGKTI